MVRPRLRSRRVPGCKPDSTEDPPVWGLLQVKSCAEVKHPPVGVMSKLGKCGAKLRCRPRHLTAVQNYEVRSKIALVLLQNGSLIQLS
ncbi:hypothetical protein AVEN_99512-1 [Araneus ventricosus]|uniref:Uncharacterized protein n=1 Tax=Araneus ventricosus TaxID=182803 RepID=A0A4Y2CQU7_ARAVE|nr:hypothetical protein AVEN_99512-1 [Araneus ventricosus]